MNSNLRDTTPMTIPLLRVVHPMTQRIAIHAREGVFLLHWRDIERGQADNNYTRIYLVTGESLFVSKTLGRLQQVLPEDLFLRIHSSHLVRIDHISQVTRDEIIMRDKTMLPVSREGRKQVLDRLAACSHKL